MKLSRRLLLVATSALILAGTLPGCLQLSRGYQQETETSRYTGEALVRSGQNENPMTAHASRSVSEDIAPWGLWDSLVRGWRADLDFWSK